MVMKSIFISFIVLSFVGIAVFGVFMMNDGSDYNHNGCIAATAQKMTCPEATNAASFLSFHFDAFQSFTTAIFGKSAANALLLFLLLLAALSGTIAQKLRLKSLAAAFAARLRLFKLRDYSFEQRLYGWLALHEKSPAFI